MKRILFVDDEPRILEGLRRMLHSRRHEWDMEFAAGGAEALRVLAEWPADVVVTDMRMPGMNGDEVLKQVMERHPQAVRIVLSGHADQAATLQAVKHAHQYLSKPCEAETLQRAVNRAFTFRDLLADGALQAVVSRVTSLPSVPTIYQELTSVLDNPECSLQDAATIIERDTAMTAKLLQLVNSAFFGARARITTPVEAVSYLGLDTVRALALSVGVFSQFDASRVRRFAIGALTEHGTKTGVTAQQLLKKHQASGDLSNHALVGGLLHDVGKLVLVSSAPAKYDEVIGLAKSRGITIWEAERAVFNCSHAEVGGYLLWLWGLPDAVVEAVAFHHEPSRSPSTELRPLAAVHVADILTFAPNAISGARPAPDIGYLRTVGLEMELQAAEGIR